MIIPTSCKANAKMDCMEENNKLMKHWTAFTTLGRIRWSRSEQLPYQVEMHAVRILSSVHPRKFKRMLMDMLNQEMSRNSKITTFTARGTLKPDTTK